MDMELYIYIYRYVHTRESTHPCIYHVSPDPSIHGLVYISIVSACLWFSTLGRKRGPTACSVGVLGSSLATCANVPCLLEHGIHCHLCQRRQPMPGAGGGGADRQRSRRQRDAANAAPASAGSAMEVGFAATASAGSRGLVVRARAKAKAAPETFPRAPDDAEGADDWIRRGVSADTVPYREEVLEMALRMHWPTRTRRVEDWCCVVVQVAPAGRGGSTGVRPSVDAVLRMARLARWPTQERRVGGWSCVVFPCFDNLADAMQQTLEAHGAVAPSDDDTAGAASAAGNADGAATGGAGLLPDGPVERPPECQAS